MTLKQQIEDIVGAAMMEYAPLNRPIRPYFEIVDEAVSKIMELTTPKEPTPEQVNY